MTRKELIDELLTKGKNLGLEDMEIFIQGNKRLDLRVFKGEIDKYSISNEGGLSLRGTYKGKMGYSYTEKLDKSSIDMLINEAISNALAIDSDDKEEILKPSESYKEVNNYNKSLEETSVIEKIDFTKKLEEKAFQLDSRVSAVTHCVFGEESFEMAMYNTKGMELENKGNIAYGYLNVMVKDGEEVKTAGKYVIGNDFSGFKPEELAKEAVDEATSMLGADSIESDDYTVIIRNDAAAELLEAFVPIFSAENVQKDLSLLKNKMNKDIASSIVTIVDNPFMDEGVASSSFDGEGVPTKYKKLIDKGVLSTYLHNSKTAKKDGIESTGNAYKSSYKAPISISPTNMYVEKGHLSLDEMIRTIDRGIMIINVEGLHAGLNTVSGDFSLSSYGYLIEEGMIKRPVNQITIAGNFYDLLKNIEMIGSDLQFTLPSGQGYIGCPSLKIKKLSISGK